MESDEPSRWLTRFDGIVAVGEVVDRRHQTGYLTGSERLTSCGCRMIRRERGDREQRCCEYECDDDPDHCS